MSSLYSVPDSSLHPPPSASLNDAGEVGDSYFPSTGTNHTLRRDDDEDDFEVIALPSIASRSNGGGGNGNTASSLLDEQQQMRGHELNTITSSAAHHQQEGGEGEESVRTTSSSTETERGDNSFDPLSILESIREEQRRSAEAVKEMEAAVAAQVPKLKDEIRQREQEICNLRALIDRNDKEKTVEIEQLKEEIAELKQVCQQQEVKLTHSEEIVKILEAKVITVRNEGFQPSEELMNEQRLIAELNRKDSVIEKLHQQLDQSEKRANENKENAETLQEIINVLREENQELDRLLVVARQDADRRINVLTEQLARCGRQVSEDDLLLYTCERCRTKLNTDEAYARHISRCNPHGRNDVNIEEID